MHISQILITIKMSFPINVVVKIVAMTKIPIIFFFRKLLKIYIEIENIT